MTRQIKKVKFFTADNYEKEEAYLREMSLKGWHFKNLQGLTYTFEKGEPKSYCYRLDLIRDVEVDREYHIKLYEDCGWDNIFEFPIPFTSRSKWEYFRIESQTGYEEELFTDNESKIELLKRVRGVYTLMLVIVIAVNIPAVMRNLSSLSEFIQASGLILAAADIFVVSLYFKILFRITMKIGRLGRKA